MQQEHEYVESEADLGDFETAGRIGKGRGPRLMDPIPVLVEGREGGGGGDIRGGTSKFSLLYFSRRIPILSLECM